MAKGDREEKARGRYCCGCGRERGRMMEKWDLWKRKLGKQEQAPKDRFGFGRLREEGAWAARGGL